MLYNPTGRFLDVVWFDGSLLDVIYRNVEHYESPFRRHFSRVRPLLGLVLGLCRFI